MFKNVSIKQVSTYLVIVIGVVNLLILYVSTAELKVEINWGKLILATVLGGIASYFIIMFFLERFILRKINVIYQIIHKSKTDKNDVLDHDIRKRSIESVNNEVIEWAEDTQKQLKSAQLLSNYRKNFVGNVSHELKTPIFSIQGYLHTLVEGGIHDNNINMKFLKRALVNTERLKVIVEDLESISRLESGELALSSDKFDIKKLVLDVIEDLDYMAKDKNISLSLKKKSDTPLFVLGDINGIRQVLANLIVNSIKYGNDNGITTVSFYHVADVILVEVSDDGIGIEEKHLDHLFDRFYRVDFSRSRDQGGSGLGLSIVKHIIEGHNQTINVRSTVNVGSTFGFTLQKA